MPKLSPDQWQEVSPYLDQALAMGEERAAWLDALHQHNPVLAALLQTLLDEHRVLAQEGFLEGVTAPLPERLELAGRTVGAYTLISQIGQGGMGSVWLAERSDGRFEGRAAVKFLNVALIGRGEERFKREGSILARVAHPHIAGLLDAGVSPNGQPYLVLEYVEGECVDRYCDERRLDAEARVTLFLDVLAAVAHAHAHLIVHRDIKPPNVLVNQQGQVKLLDFGIAKLLEGEAESGAATRLTVEGGRAMTPEYAAPEQLRGGAITTATDVYGLGVLLFVLLTGQHPAGAGTLSTADLVKAIVDVEPPRASDTVTSVRAETEVKASNAANRGTTPDKLHRILRGDLDTILAKALKKNPHERYASVTALADDLRRYLKCEAISAQPDSSWYLMKKFLSRRRWAVASVASIVLALALGLSAALWQAHIARRETRIATAIGRFLEDIFRANSSDQEDPLKARQTTARELLDIGARKLDSELADVPEAKLNILNTLGGMYFDLGLDDQAVDMQRKRVALSRKYYGNDSTQVAAALVDLGDALHASHSANEGEAVLLEAKRILDRRGDFSSRLRGNLLAMLAQQYESSDLQQSLDYSRQAVELSRHYPGDPNLAEALFQEASVLSLLAQPRQAEQLLGEAVGLSIKLQGDPNPNLPRFYAFRGQAQQQLMAFAGAEDSLRRAARAAEKLNGTDHVDTLETELRLGSFLVATSRPQEGLQHMERAKDILLRTRGAADPFYAPKVFVEYGQALASVGRLDDGLAYISRAVENRRKNRPGTQYLGRMLEEQASVLIDLGRYAEAKQVADEASRVAKQVNFPPTYTAVDDRARLLIAADRANEANAALDAFHPSAPAEGALSLDAMKLLALRAEIALARGDAETAAQLAGQVNRELSASTARDYLKWLEARVALVEGRANLRMGRPSEALPLLQRAVTLREVILDPVSPALADARIALAECYLDLGQPDRAARLAADARRTLASHRELGSQYTRALQELQQRLRQRSPLRGVRDHSYPA